MGSEDDRKLIVGSIRILSRMPEKKGDSIKSTLNTGRYYHVSVSGQIPYLAKMCILTFKLSLLFVLAHFFR